MPGPGLELLEVGILNLSALEIKLFVGLTSLLLALTVVLACLIGELFAAYNLFYIYFYHSKNNFNNNSNSKDSSSEIKKIIIRKIVLFYISIYLYYNWKSNV